MKIYANLNDALLDGPIKVTGDSTAPVIIDATNETSAMSAGYVGDTRTNLVISEPQTTEVDLKLNQIIPAVESTLVVASEGINDVIVAAKPEVQKVKTNIMEKFNDLDTTTKAAVVLGAVMFGPKIIRMIPMPLIIGAAALYFVRKK